MGRQKISDEEWKERWQEARANHEAGKRPIAADMPMSPAEEKLIKNGLIAGAGKIAGAPAKAIADILMNPKDVAKGTPAESKEINARLAAEKEQKRLADEAETKRVQKAREPWDRARENHDPKGPRQAAMQRDRDAMRGRAAINIPDSGI